MDSLTDYIKKAFSYKDAGDYKKSMDFFYKALAMDSESSEILKELAFLYSSLCQYDRAVALYEQVITKNPDNYSAKLAYARLCIKLKNIQKAKELLNELFNIGYEINSTSEEYFNILFEENSYEKLISLFKSSKKEISSSASLYLVGFAFSKLSCLDKAEEYFNKSFSIQANNIDAGYNLAKLLFEKKLYSDSERLLFSLLNFSEDDRVFALLAEIRYINKNLEDAIKYFSYAIRVNPKDAEYFYRLGVVYSLKGFMNEAEQSYCKAVAIEPENILYNYTLAYLYYTNNKVSLAENLVDYLFSLNADYTGAIALKILLMLKKGDAAEAKNYVDKIDEMADKDDFSYYALASYYSKLSLWDKAVIAINKAIELNPESIEYKYLLSKIYFTTGDYEQSKELCNKILSENDKYIQAYILRSQIFKEQEIYDLASDDIDNALKLDINSSDAYYLKGCLKLNSSDYEGALECFKTAASISPDNEKNYFGAAISYYNLKEYEQAYTYFKEAADINISEPEYRYYMAKCCINSNDSENAIANFSVLRRLAPYNIDYAQEYAMYLKKSGNKKAGLSVLKSTLKIVSSKEEKETLKKIIKIF